MALAKFVVIISPSASILSIFDILFYNGATVAQQLRLVDQLEEDMAWQRRSKKD